MKRFLLLSLTTVLLLCCGCTRTGERDSADFIALMAKNGYDCVFEEISSTENLTESCYVNGAKISLFSTQNGKLHRVMLTSTDLPWASFVQLAESCMKSSGLTVAQAQAAMEKLGLNSTSVGNSTGVAQYETSPFLLIFTSDEAGAALAIDNLRLMPTQAPTVTTRSGFTSTEKAAP